MDEWFGLLNGSEVPVASDVPDGKTWEQNFRGWYAMWRDHKFEKRDVEWIESLHTSTTVENWMRDTKFNGVLSFSLLKNVIDQKTGLHPKVELTSKL